jgi:PAS domain S-box-containing protein/putative nucleotidyltransferase with HDIG domain
MKNREAIPPLWVTAIYVLFASLWILLSDILVSRIEVNAGIHALAQTLKGWGFVAVTGLILYFVLRFRQRALENTRKAQLRETEEKDRLSRQLQHYLEVSPTIIYAIEVKDGRAQTVWVSENVERILGYSTEEALEPDWWNRHMRPEDMKRLLQNHTNLFDTSSTSYEYRFFRRDRSEVWLLDEFRVIDDVENGKEVVGAWTDISERKRFEQELNDRTREYETVFNGTHSGMFLVEALDEYTFRYIRNNLAHQETTGLSLEDLKGRTPQELLGEEQSKEIVQNYRHCLMTAEPVAYDQTIDLPGGKRIAHVVLTPVLNKTGQVSHIVGSVLDITELRKAEAAFRESEGLLREAQEAAGIGSYIVDLREGKDSHSENMYRIYGVDPENTDQFEQWGSMIHPLWREHVLEHFGRLTEGSPHFEEEYKMIRQNDGEERWVRDICKAEFDDDGKPVRFIGTVQDITDRKLREEELRSRNHELEALYKLSTDLRRAVDSKTLLDIVLERCRQLANADHGLITTLSDDRRNFYVTTGFGIWKDIESASFSSDLGLSGLVLAKNGTYRTSDYSSEARALQVGAFHEVGPAVFVPIESEERLLGVLGLGRDRFEESTAFSQEEVRMLETIGEMVGNAVRRLGLFEDAERRFRQTQALRNIDMAITGSLDLRVTLRVALDEVTKQLGADAATVALKSTYSGDLRYEAWRGFHFPDPGSAGFKPGEGYVRQLLLSRESVIVPDISQDQSDKLQKDLLERECFESYYAVPLIAKGQTQGVLEVFGRKKIEPDEEWLEFLEILAGQVAVAVDNAELFHRLERSNVELREAYDTTIEGWAHALDLRDEETEGHSRRVTDITLAIAHELGVREDEMPHVRRGALLHDIGKMAIPDSILQKPGKLTEEEWDEMKQHPVYAHKMLSGIDYLRPALDIPYCHHEKWDGTGYPRGLKGKEIPLPARIFAVVDVFDALTSERPYRKAWTRNKALSYILDQSGKHFDPRVAKIFLSKAEAGDIPTQLTDNNDEQ